MDKLYVNKLWVIYENVLNMCADRKYVMLTTRMSRDQFLKKEANLMKSLDIRAMHGTIKVFIHISKIIGSFIKDSARRVIQNVKSAGISAGKIIIVVDTNIGVTLKRQIENPAYDVEYININRFKFNLTKHSMYVYHELLDEEMSSDEYFATNATFTKENIPYIYDDDAVSIWFGAKEGQVFKIIRKNGYEGLSNVIYRRVVKAIPADKPKPLRRKRN